MEIFIFSIITLIILGLKMLGIYNYSWLWVLLPFVLYLIYMIVAFCIVRRFFKSLH